MSKIKEFKDSKTLKEILAGISVSIVIIVNLFPIFNAHYRKKASYEENEALLNRYNDYIDCYSKEFECLDLEDLDIFEKIILDSKENGFKYKIVDEIPFGYERLFLYATGYGDCCNFSDDMTAKLNKINNSYNARNLYVYMHDTKDNVSNDTLYQDEFDKFIYKSILKVNHCITAVDIDDKILVIDPTNEAIGTIKNGKIIMFDSDLDFELSSGYTYIIRGIDEFLSLNETITKSFDNKANIEQLQEEYGKDAQEKSYQKVLTYNINRGFNN